MLLSVHCVYDTSLQFTLTPDTHAYSDLKFCPTWLNNIQHYNIQQNTWTFWILVPFPEISSQFFICMFYHPLYNCFKYFPSAKRELLFSGSLRLCKFIAFSCRLNLIICLLRVKQLWMVGFICLELSRPAAFQLDSRVSLLHCKRLTSKSIFFKDEDSLQTISIFPLHNSSVGRTASLPCGWKRG